ncbi:MAG: hypothetical protein F4Z01_06820 [Gammaproteobacteria bacterium]|nr:hypothetical protein [Gammaproteobacteria bacterium]
MSKRTARLLWLTPTGLTVLLLLILFSFTFADNGLDGLGGDLPSLDDGDDGSLPTIDDGDTGVTGPVGSVDDGAPVSDSSLIPLKNASFEQGSDSPVGWRPLVESLDGSYLWDTEVASSGSRSLFIGSTRYAYGRWSSDAVDVQKGGYNWYTLTGDVKTDQNTGEVYLAIAWFDEKGAMLTSSDSLMLAFGDLDWQSVRVTALPPAGAVTFSVWCISNHNAGFAWFDNLELRLTQLPARGKASYAQFLVEHPSHPLVLEAHSMRVGSLMTAAKWIREDGFYDPKAQLKASQLYAEAASVGRLDGVLQGGVTVSGGDFSEEKGAFEDLIDEALLSAGIAATRADDPTAARGYLSKVVERNRDETVTESASEFIEAIFEEGNVND